MVTVNILKLKLVAGPNVKVVCCINGDSSQYDLCNIITLTQSNLPWPTCQIMRKIETQYSPFLAKISRPKNKGPFALVLNTRSVCCTM